MNVSKTLYWVLNALIFLVIVSIVYGSVVTILLITGAIPDQLYQNIIPYSELDEVAYIFMFLSLITYIVFIYGLFKLRKVAKLFLNNTIYDFNLGRNCNIAGKSFVISGVFWWMFDGISALHYNNEFSIGLSQKTFVYLFFISIGLFLMLTSQFFDNAVKIKEENDLTI